MRIWSLHPCYLDAKGLVALWRETLLAQNVLLDKTKGYKHHPQLRRFRLHPDPIGSIANYLHAICDESEARDYQFQRSKINQRPAILPLINVTSGQMEYEWQHFLKKALNRDPDRFDQYRSLRPSQVLPHPLFSIHPGPIEDWEIVGS